MSGEGLCNWEQLENHSGPHVYFSSTGAEAGAGGGGGGLRFSGEVSKSQQPSPPGL